MPRPAQLSGKRFGRLTVSDKWESRNGNRYWLCHCDCGNDKWIMARSLVSGNTKSCGCLSREKAREGGHHLQGQKFGRLTVLDVEPKLDKNGNRLWYCQCDCGTKKWIRGVSLVRGETTSCGCARRESSYARRKNLKGKRFGRLVVLDEEPKLIGTGGRKRVHWHCKCDCGNDLWVMAHHLLNGHTVSCGCYNKDRRKELAEKNFVEGTSITNLLQKVNDTNLAGYKNVSLSGTQGYRASIRFKGEDYYLGSYKTAESAAAAAKSFREDVIIPFLEDKTLGIREVNGKYLANFKGKDLGEFDSLEDANLARFKEAAKYFKTQKNNPKI